MKLVYGNKELKINKNIIFLFYIVIVIISKVVRYTVMKATLVDSARGDEILYDILYNGNLMFKFSTLSSSIAFNNSAFIFKFMNVFELTTYTEFEVYISILWNILVLKLIYDLDKIENNLQSLYLILTIAVLNIFNFTIAKEPIQILYFVMIYIVLWLKISEKKKLIFITMVILFSTFTFRSYYILFACFTVMMYFIFKILLTRVKKVKFFHIIIILAIILASVFAFLVVAQKITPKYYHEILTVRTHSTKEEAATKIRTLVSGSTSNKVFYLVEYLILIFRMMIPLELVFKGPKYILFVLYQIIITYYIIKMLKNYRNNNSIQNLSLCVYIAFILVSATFEPDFGSWIRHEASAFPVFLVITGLNKKRRMKINE